MSYPADRNPMSEARRQQVHGSLKTDGTNRFTVAAIALILAITIGAAGFAMLPAALSASPRADAQPVRDVEAVAGEGLGK